MARFCSDCKNLNTKDSKGDGIYKCGKIKKHILANTPACDKFENNYGLRAYDKEKLYDLGKSAMNKPSGDSIGMDIFILVMLIIVIIMTKLFGN